MQIETTRKFDKQFRKLPTKIQKEFAKRIDLFLTERNHALLHTHKLSGNLRGLWSFNVTADVRVVFDDSYEDVVILVAVASHIELYG
ncbi:MAG: type II toxin-antitoxin system mRNA interferase toxin, RelE/StbE family [Candidatus Paceibacterota bacterium]